MNGIVPRTRRVHATGALLLLLSAGGLNQRATAATLQQLLSGGVLNVGNSQFSDWELVSLDATAAVPNLAQITVNPLQSNPANPGLAFAANGQLTIAGTNNIDLTFKYRVHALPGAKALTGHSLELTDITLGDSAGLAFITDEPTADSGDGLNSTIAIVDKASNFSQLLDTTNFAPHSGVSVVTSVFLHGTAATDAITLTSFTQKFSQTGPVFAAGDFDEDGKVDAADLVRWKTGLGASSATHVQGDADGERDVDGADLLIWQHDRAAVPPAQVAAIAAPEPASISLASIAAFVLGRRASRRRRSKVTLEASPTSTDRTNGDSSAEQQEGSLTPPGNEPAAGNTCSTTITWDPYATNAGT